MSSADPSSSKRGPSGGAAPSGSGAVRRRETSGSRTAPTRRAASVGRTDRASQASPGRARRWLRRLRLVVEVGCAAAALALAALWASLPDVAELAKRPPASTAFIDLRRAQAAAAKRPFQLKWQWRRLDQISQYLRAAVVYAEDLHFYDHDGVDWGALEKAAQSNYQRGALSIGGSTITQQLAKNLFLSPSRSLLRKAREILIAGRLEDAMDKQRILELYLNVVEWGDGIFGAEAAARHWFGRSARQLTPQQAARLAVALPNPFTRTPRVRTATLQRKVARILWQLRRDGLINRAQLAAAAAEGGLPAPPATEPPLDELPRELREAAGLDDREEEADRERAAEGAPAGASDGAAPATGEHGASEGGGDGDGDAGGAAAPRGEGASAPGEGRAPDSSAEHRGGSSTGDRAGSGPDASSPGSAPSSGERDAGAAGDAGAPQ